MKQIIFFFFILLITSVLNANEYQNNEENKEYNNSSSEIYYECDSRKYCSQMRSCKEAKFFLEYCADPKMDGDNDGIPCEKQWCN